MATTTVTLVGVPWDGSSSFLRGAAQAPPRIREALRSPSSNLATEGGLDLGLDTGCLRDAGDLVLSSAEQARREIEDGVESLLAHEAPFIALGGDHAVTYPIVRAVARRYPGLNVLHLDAHPDLYDTFEGDPWSHACPFARIMEERLAVRLVQVGIRTATSHQREQAARFGVEVIEAGRSLRDLRLVFDGPVYLSLDLDVLDPAFAPGVSHHEPGGLSTRDVLRLVQTFEGRLVGADIVEYNPARDIHGVTAMVAAKCVKELAARMLEELSRG